VLSTHRLEFGCLDASVDEESCDVLWSTVVRRNRFVRDVDQGCSASAVKLQGLLAYDGSMEAESGPLHIQGRYDFADSGGSAPYELRMCILESSILRGKPRGAERASQVRHGAHPNGWVNDRCGCGTSLE